MATLIRLLEDNKDIESLVKQLDGLIANLRKSQKLEPELIKYLQDFYEDEILPFTRYHYLVGKEPNKIYEEKLKDKITDLIITLGNIK
jgi:hypothetical protein